MNTKIIQEAVDLITDQNNDSFIVAQLNAGSNTKVILKKKKMNLYNFIFSSIPYLCDFF